MASSTLRSLPGDVPPTTLLTLPDEMLEEILLCVSDAADLVRASMARVSIRRLVTNHRFLRRFRARQPPPLLGIVSPYPRPRWDRPLLNLAQPPHPSAAAASAFSGLDAADFSCAFLPNAARWRRRDMRDGRVLLSGIPEGMKFHSIFFVRDLAVCEPLSRRYILLPPIPDDLAALAPDLLCFEPFLAPPAAEGEGGMSFRVICLVQCKTKLVLLIVSSGSGAGQWRAVTFDNWISLLTGSDNQPESYRRSRIRHYAHGYFCWVLSPASKLLMLDTCSMGFSVVDLPHGTSETEAQVAILEAENGRIKMFINEHFTTELRYYVLQNDGVAANQWLSEATFNLPVNNGGYMFMGVAGGYLLLQGLGEGKYSFHLVSLNLKTLQLEWFLASMRNNKGAHLFAGFPPSLSPPTLRHDI